MKLGKLKDLKKIKMYPEVSRSLFKTDRRKTILQAVLVLSVSLVMMNLNALIDHFLHPEIPYFDHEHLIVGGVTALLTAVLFGGLTVYMNRLENPLKEQKKAEEALKESENRFKLLAEKSLVGIYLIQDDTFKYVNPRLAEIFGYTVGEIIDKKGPSDIVLQEDLPVVEENIGKRIAGEIEFVHYELRGVKKNKEIINAEVYGSRIMYNGRPAVIGTLLDVTERKQTEEKLRRTTKSLRVLSECNQALLYFSEESDLLKEICRIIVESGGYRLAWVGYAMQDESKRVSPVAQYGFEEGYLETIKVTWADNESGIGPSGTAIRTGKTYIARSIMNDPNFAPWRAEALKRGYNSSVALPLFIEGAVIGALRIYSVDSDAFDSEEIELLTELSLDLSYGIKYIRTTSEHRKAVESLRQSEQRYRDLVENARDVIFTLSADGTITSLNPAFETITGWSRSEWVSKNFVQIIHPDDLPLAMEKFQSVLRGEEPYMFELRSLSRSGEYLVAEFMVTPKVQDGKIVGLLGIARDITERKQIEEEKDKLLIAIDSSTEGIAITDGKDRFIYVNASHAKIYGYPHEELMGKTWRDIIPCEIKAQAEEAISTAVRNKESTIFSGEVPALKKDGTIIPTEVVATGLWDEKGNYEGHICIVRDITERKQAEEALQSAEERYRTTVDSMSDAINLVDKDLKVIFLNEAFKIWCEKLGLKITGTGQNLFDLFPFLPDKVRDEYRQVFNTGRTLVTEEINKFGDREIITETRKIPIFENGKVLRVVTVVRDITDRKKVDEEIKKRIKELEEFYQMAVGRELKMVELKKEIEGLEERLRRYEKL